MPLPWTSHVIWQSFLTSTQPQTVKLSSLANLVSFHFDREPA
jgi:hypothetical protein